ncbi:MAG: flagellar export protein FliJ [Lachnospiraceae bacterium]|nr:flagellar export protein FliJ [Lachnospiraceae bacterium]
MAKFVFSLEGILNLKVKQEDNAKTQYGLAQMKLNEEEEKLSALFRRKEDYLEEKRSAGNGVIVVKKLVLLENAIKSTEDLIEIQKGQVDLALIALDKAREELNLAIQERKTYDKLKEKAFEKFLEDVKKEEQLEINELVSFRYSKEGNENG